MLTSSITQTTSRKLLEAKLIKWNTPSPRDPNNYSRFGCANHHHSYTAHEDGISKREQTRLSSIKRASYVSNGIRFIRLTCLKSAKDIIQPCEISFRIGARGMKEGTRTDDKFISAFVFIETVDR